MADQRALLFDPLDAGMDEEDNEMHSTVYFTSGETRPETSVQQSFIFGPGNFYTSHDRPPKNAPQRDAIGAVPLGFDREGTLKGQEADHVISMMTPATTKTLWFAVIRHWLLSTLVLPLYALALVTHTWKHTPRALSKFAGTLVLAGTTGFYALLWLLFSLYISSDRIKALYPVSQACFIFFLYTMCCLAESMLKNTSIDAASNNEVTNDTNLALMKQEDTFTSIWKKEWTTARYLDDILEKSNPHPTTIFAVHFVSFLVACLYGGSVLALHLWKAQLGREPLSVYIYIAAITLAHTILGFVIIYPIGQVFLRLSVRAKVAVAFVRSVTYGRDGNAFRLNSLQNIHAWQLIRDTLLRQYAFPTPYVDVVMSAAFTLWVPLVIVGALEFVFRLAVTPLAMNTSVLAVIVLLYLLVCVVSAASVQETLSNTDVLRFHEYHFLLSAEQNNGTFSPQEQINDATPKNDKGKEESTGPQSAPLDATIGTNKRSLAHILKRLAALIEQSKDNAVVFQVWGFPLNRKMSTFLGGVLVTLGKGHSSLLLAQASCSSRPLR